jgi:hypothetical protein
MPTLTLLGGAFQGGILGASVFSSICPVIHQWHRGDNHVAIDLIVQHICTKLGQHDFHEIYPNVYEI